MQLHIRNIIPGDASAINNLSQQLGYPASVRETEQSINEVIATADNIAFVALADEKIVGWIHGFKSVKIESLPFIEIGGLVIDESYRNRQIGKGLIEKIKEWAAEKNMGTIRVRCNTKRKESHKFYMALGFIETKEQKTFQLSI